MHTTARPLPRQRFETSSLVASVLLARPSVSEELRDDVATSLKTKGFVANAKANASASGAGAVTRGTGTIRLLLDHAREALRCAQAHHTSKTGMHPRVALAHRRVGDGLMLAAGEMLRAANSMVDPHKYGRWLRIHVLVQAG